MTTTAPPPAECQILQTKHLFKLKIRHDITKYTYQKPTNLIAISAAHGLTFVGEYNALKVIATSKLYEETRDFNVETFRNYYHRNIALPASPTHIDINAEQKLLAVAFIYNDVPVLRIYVIDSFLAQDVTHFPEIRLSSTSGTYITDFSWNPGISNILACCISDGTLSTYTFNSPGNFEVKSLPKESLSVCVCWSPKGKQIVVGNYNGYLTQYLPELRAVKNMPPPTGLFPKACTLCSVKWISNFQFIGVYKTQEQRLADDEEIKSCVVVINTPKNGPVQYINYDDVCFSFGTDRPVQFYFNHIPAWNLIFVSSSNSLEVAVLSLDHDNQTWVLWNLEPEVMRITLPTLKRGEAFPVGVAIDYTVPVQTPIGDKNLSMPALSVLTSEGLLCIYLITYLNPAVPNVCNQASGSLFLEYFSTESVTDEEPAQMQPCNAVSAQESSSSQDLSGITYNLDQYIPQMQEVMALADAALKHAQDQLQMPNTNLLNKLNPTFNFETSLAKGMASESAQNIEYVQTSSTVFSPSTQNEPQLAQKLIEHGSSTLPSSSSEATGVVKKAEPSKPRQEAVKKLKKRASVFENDMQEIKYLISNIHVGSNEPTRQITEKFAELESSARRLKDTGVELRSDIDLLRTNIIEVFACVQDVKSKLFQFMNPGYQSLTGIQDIDPISSNNLKTVQCTINYAQTQAEKADKQLEEMWFKFSQNPAAPTTKVPILENVYETIMKQQKILTCLKLHTDKLEKRFTTIIHRLNRENRLIQDSTSQVDMPWSKNKLGNENMSLDELTKKALNLNTFSDAQLDPKQLALKYSREHAKRFNLSYAKQVKLQELHSTSGVTYIQSSRLQRLKKKSLIILSKSTCKPVANDEEIAEKLQSEPPRGAIISPVSSDDEKSTGMNNVVSSTPFKSTQSPRFAMESTLPIEPSIITPVISAPTKLIFSVPASTSVTASISSSKQDDMKAPENLISKSEKTVMISTKQAEPVTVLVTESAPAFASSIFGTTIFAGKPSATATPLLTSIPTTSSQPPPTTRTIFSAIGATIDTKTVTSTVSTQGSFFSGMNPFGSNVAISSAPTVTSTGMPASNVTFSFNLPKSETSPTTTSLPPAAVSMTSSIFSSKPLPTFETVSSAVSKSSLPAFGTAPNVVVSSSATSGGSLFKSIAPQSNTLPCFATMAATATNTPANTMVSERTTVSTTFTVLPNTSMPAKSSSSVFEGASMFGKPAPSTNNIINSLNFGAMLSGSLFADKSTAATSTTTASVQKNNAFSSFSFANKPPIAASSVTITEVTNEEEKDMNKENVSSPGTTPNISFSFTNPPSLFSPIKSVSGNGVTVSSTINDAAAATSSLASNAATPEDAASTGFSVAVTSAAAPTVTSTTSSGTGAFDNGSSFFGSLKLKTSPTGENTNTNASIFGKTPSVVASSAPSLFSGNNTNMFSQAANATAVSTAAESKPLFGSGTTSPLFGQGAVASAEYKNLFSGSASGGSFQSTGSLFSSGGSMFGGGSTFGAASTAQASRFGSSSGGSLFGSGFNTAFQSTSSGFGSPPSFSNTVQSQQSATAGGFGSPATFPSVFNKTGSTFAAFGSAPTFGGSPTCGTSPTKVFGQSPSNIGTFGGTNTQQQPGFETLANENTLTFGNLAQQQQPSGFGSPPSFGNANANSAFGSSTNFGSSSFSSWR